MSETALRQLEELLLEFQLVVKPSGYAVMDARREVIRQRRKLERRV